MIKRLIFAAICALLPIGAEDQSRYESEFLWGAAISAHQVEGVFGGGQNSDWWLFEHTGNHILNGDTADMATDHWHRYPEDFALAKSIGLRAIRTSVAWEKIEPAQGVFRKEAIDHYRAEFQLMRRMGLRPLITLQHGTVPLWFQNRGGWLRDDSPELFVNYVDFVVRALGDLCDLWGTINEPTSLIGEGYFYGNTPPQIQSPTAAIVAMLNVIRAHRLATARIHELQPGMPGTTPGARLRGVGLVNSLQIFDPYRPWNAADVAATGLIDELWNWAVITAAVGVGPTVETALERIAQSGGQLPTAQAKNLIQRLVSETTPASQVVDWLGVNLYTRNLIEADSNGTPIFHTPPGPVGDNGWSVYPPGLERIIRAAHQRYPSLPIVVTEHGMADGFDRLRPYLIRESLRYLDRAKFGHDGLPPIDVRGYFHWSLIDNFEWRYGYAHRFGLFAILYDDGLKRVRRPSAEVYAQEIRSR